MRTERFVISDRSWAIIEPLVPGSVRDSGVTARDTRFFWKLFYGVSALAALGAIFRRGLAPGTVSSGVFAAGRKAVFFNAFSRLYRTIQILSMSSLMERSSALTRRQAAQKGDSQSGHWTLKRRIDHQSSGPHRCLGKSRSVQTASRPAQ